MRTMDDRELLQEYANGGSESAFAELVRRHLNWVYSAALREVGDALLAQEVAQSVFVLLARKAGSLRSRVVVSGWLFRTTRFVASRALRAESRRKRREQEAFAMNPSTTDETDAVWQRLAPHLDQAVASLTESDRSAVLLRFYEKKTLEDVGRRLGISEEAAKKRVSRAVNKMRDFMSRRGLTLGTAALVSLMGLNTVKSAPAALALSVMSASHAVSTSTALPELARQTLNAWRLMKVKLVTALAGGTVITIAVMALQHPSVDLSKAAGASANQTESALVNATSQTVPDETQTGLSRNLPAGAVAGLVLDEHDTPIPDAHVWAGFANGPDSETHTDGSGHFMLTAIGVRNSVTVSAPGFSADQQNVDTNHLSKPIVFHLTGVGPLRFRVIDEAGLPIKGADVSLDNWWGGRLDTLIIRRATSEDGRVEWDFAPKGELEVCVLKSGYLSSRQHKIVADNAEHVIVLHPALTVTGNVTDGESGELVAGFTLTRGYSQIFSASIGESSPNWDLHERWHGTNGFYKVTFDEEGIPQLHVEAEGYEVLEVKPQFTNGPQTVFDFQLRRLDTNHAVRGTVLLPNGQPARDVEVALCTFQVGVWVNGTSFRKEVYANSKINLADYRQKTDQRGQFNFAPQPGSHTVVAVSSEGVGRVHCFDLSEPLEIRLQPWGRIEGVVRLRQGSPANRRVEWSGLGTLHSGMDVYFNHDYFAAVSDSVGNFFIEHVPPGAGNVALFDGNATLCQAPVHVDPGQTLQLQLGGTGSPVTGKLIAPQGVEVRSWSNQLFVAEISSQWDNYSIPNGLEGEKMWRWQMEFAESDAGRSKLGNGFHYRLNVQPDGSFFVPDVFPGRYQVIITLNEGALSSGPSSVSPQYLRQIASLWHKFEVPETSSDSASQIDLGELVLNPSP